MNAALLDLRDLRVLRGRIAVCWFCEYAPERLDDGGLDVRHRDFTPEQSLDRRDAVLPDAARHDASKKPRSVLTLSAKPCEVIQPLETRTPMAATFSSPDPHAGEAVLAAGRNTETCERTDQHLLQVTHVAVQVAAVGLQVEDGVADELAGAVVGDVAAAAGLEESIPSSGPGRGRAARSRDAPTCRA
jgi:hypothetical protein